MSDVDIRVIGSAETATDAVGRLAEVFEIVRQGRPRPSRDNPEQVLVYLTVRPRAGQPAARAPLAEVEDRKAARDLPGELDAITGHWNAMESQPWWPPQIGDVVIGHPGELGGHGETFLAIADLDLPDGVRFTSVSRPSGNDYNPKDGYAIHDLWFEWAAISIVRAGVLYGRRPR